jgi:hypothetical protein
MSEKQTYTPPWQVHFQRGYQRGAEAMREAAIKLCDSSDVSDIEEYADCIRALPLPEPPK